MTGQYTFTKDDVVCYLEGDLDDPQEIGALEQARRSNPEVARWFLEAVKELGPSPALEKMIREWEPVAPPAGAAACQVSSQPAASPALSDPVSKMIADFANGVSNVKAAALDTLSSLLRLPAGAMAAPAGERLARLENPVALVGGQLCLNVPADEMPFGVVRVFLRHRPTDVLVATWLEAVGKSGSPPRRVGYVDLDRRLAGLDCAELEPTAQPAKDKPAVLNWFPLCEVEALLKGPAASADADLAEDVKRLVELLRPVSSSD
jgi:hypothetical protein